MNALKSIARRMIDLTSASVNTSIFNLKKEVQNSHVSQRQLFFHYQHLRNQGYSLPEFRDTGFREYDSSPYSEDPNI